MMLNEVYLEDESATQAFGQLLATATAQTEFPHRTLGGRLYLTGDLGAGKTTLARGLIRAYGYQGAVKSPTYTLVEPYELDTGSLYHFDLYRLSDPEEVEFLGVFDYFDVANLCLIEWAERGKGVIPSPDLELTLTSEGAGRRVVWTAYTACGKLIAQRLSACTESLKNGIQRR